MQQSSTNDRSAHHEGKKSIDRTFRRMLVRVLVTFVAVETTIHALLITILVKHSDLEATMALDITNNIVAPLAVAALTGTATWILATWRMKRRLAAAPELYVAELDALIKRGLAEGVQKAIVNARAIVAARNSLRSSLLSISHNLNSEIDKLAREIGEEYFESSRLQPMQPIPQRAPAEQAYETIEVLSRIWPSKRAEIIVQIRKVLAELNLDSSGYGP